MNSRLEPIVLTVKMNTRLMANCFDGVDDEIGQTRVGDTNHMTFLGTHLVGSRHYYAKMAGAESVDPFAALTEGKRTIEDMDVFPEIGEIVQAWREAEAPLLEGLSSLTDEDLANDPPFQFPIGDTTLFGGLTFLCSHETYHIGQLGILRKHLGLGSMKYD